MSPHTKIQTIVLGSLFLGAIIGVFINFLFASILTRLVSGDWFLAPVTIPLTIAITAYNLVSAYREAKKWREG